MISKSSEPKKKKKKYNKDSKCIIHEVICKTKQNFMIKAELLSRESQLS